MAEQTKILEVKDLRISFNVDSGTVKAVRGISFDLYRGRTLCIVGESGSGKSVTSRAILGILAKNAIVEGGEIVFDGKDLLAINEDRFHKIRGSKISMIFQDPLSALNPIMRVGKQLTEPIFLKAKANKRESTKICNEISNAIKKTSSEKGIAIDFSLLSSFIKACKGESDLESDQLRVVRVNTFIANNKQIVENADKYPKQSVKEAKRYLRFHRPQKLKKSDANIKAFSEEDASSLAASLSAIIEASHQDYLAELKKLFDMASEIHEKLAGLSTYESLSDQFSLLAKTSNATKFLFRDDEDDVIGVFGTSLKKYLLNLSHAEKREKKEAEKKARLAAKGMEEKPLSVKQRAKMPEKTLTVEEAKSMLEKLFHGLLSHIEKEMASPFDSSLYAKKFLSYYKKQIMLARKKVSQEEAKETALDIMRKVGIPQPEIRYKQYPFEFSGGMRQRIVIAIALSSRPEILICDEPTTALDVTIQAQILELINDLKKELNLSIIFITHDLGVVANMADDIAVMYAGKIVEYGTVDDIFYDPRHPYTWALLSSMPDLETKQKLEAIPGTPPNMVLPPKGDAFAARNQYALAIDFKQEPPLFKISDTHAAATWLLLPNAPKAVPPAIVTARIERALARRKAKRKEEKKS